MSLLRASLRLLPLLALAAACTGKRGDPEPSQNPPPISGGGNGTGGTGTGGAPSNGGAGGGTGGAPSTGGMGGTPSTGGMGGTPATGGATGVGGSMFNDVSDMYPYCGCLDDAQEPGACSGCFAAASVDPLCTPAGACAGGCQAIISFILTDPSCNDIDEACLQQAFLLSPEEFDDAVDKVSCACTLCPVPFGCNPADCGP